MSQPAQQLPPGDDEFFDHAARQVRQAGLRLTPQRSAILRLFARRCDHMTPQGIFDALEEKVASLSLATVYNSLEVFEEIGVVDRVCTEDGQTYFDPNTDPHHHAVCQSCGEIFDVPISSAKLDGITQTLNSDNTVTGQFEVRSVDIWVKGVCGTCK